MTALHVIKGLPEDLPTELGRRKTLHEDERRKVNQRNEQAGQVFERTHFEKGRFFEQEAERLLGKDLKVHAAASCPIADARAALEAALEEIDVRISYHVRCRVCDRREWPAEIEQYDPGVNNYCGGSPWCCP